MPNPLISIGVPTYNRAAYVVRAVQSALAQTYNNIEIIVSDNASPDDTAARLGQIQDPRLKFLNQPKNLGFLGNYNACLAAATGELFLMLSDDDVLEPTCIERLSEPFRSAGSDEVGVVWCPAKILDSQGSTYYATAPGPVREPGWALVEGLFVGTRGPRFCSVMIRRKDALYVGGYLAEHGPILDVGNWTQVAVMYPWAVCVPEPLAGYTVHQGSNTSMPDGGAWQRAGERVTSDVADRLKARGEEAAARRIAAARKDNVTNLIVTVMMQVMGKPGWLTYWFSETRRAPQYLFSSLVLKRLFKDGRKLLLLRRQRSATSDSALPA